MTLVFQAKLFRILQSSGAVPFIFRNPYTSKDVSEEVQTWVCILGANTKYLLSSWLNVCKIKQPTQKTHRISLDFLCFSFGFLSGSLLFPHAPQIAQRLFSVGAWKSKDFLETE